MVLRETQDLVRLLDRLRGGVLHPPCQCRDHGLQVWRRLRSRPLEGSHNATQSASLLLSDRANSALVLEGDRMLLL